MDGHQWLAEPFEEHRTHLRAVAYRMLGSPSEADDGVQEAWLRLSRPDTSVVSRCSHPRRSAVREPWPTPSRAGPRFARTVWAPGGRQRVVFAFTITRGKIVELDLVADPLRLGQLDVAVLDGH